MADATRKERVVKIRMFEYTGEDGLPVFGRRGDTIKVNEADEKLGDKLGVFETDEDAAADADAPAADADPKAMTDAELIAYVNADGSTIPKLTGLAEGDPEFAERLIAAENASGRNGGPRSTLVEKLQAIVDDATS